jgi:hypothetical protein
VKEQVFGPRRSRAARKPSVQCPKVIFYRCEVCGSICQRTGWAETESGISCCGEEMEVLVPVSSRDLGSAGSMSYRIVGGYNDNAVQVFFHMEKGYELEWLYLRTFTGGYMKYIMPGKRPPCVFALADEDAFSYCDESPCLECTFWCKRGFVVYGYVKGLGLVEMPLDQVSPYWQSGAKTKG